MEIEGKGELKGKKYKLSELTFDGIIKYNTGLVVDSKVDYEKMIKMYCESLKENHPEITEDLVRKCFSPSMDGIQYIMCNGGTAKANPL